MSSSSVSQVMDGPDALADIDAAAEQEIVAKPRCVIAEVWALKGPHSSKNDGYMHINARVFFNRSDSSWYCRGPVRTKRFKVNSKRQDNTPLTGEEYKAVLASRREEAIHEMKEQQAAQTAAWVIPEW